MAFFEQFGKRISDMGEGVAQQTKKLADIARLNTSISDKEKKAVQLYTAIGQAYYERHREDADAEELDKIQELNRLHQEIKNQQEEIKQLKGVAKCPNCGADVSAHALFCNACGTKMPQEAESAPEEPAPAAEGRTCPNCHAPVKEGNLFCNQCGTKL